jgi:hypothetical protein
MSRSHRRSVIGTLPGGSRRVLGAVSVLVLLALTSCGDGSFRLNDLTIDLSAVGDTGGAVVIAGRAVSAVDSQGGSGDADAVLTASNTSGTLHVVVRYMAVDPATDAQCTQVAGAGSDPTYFLCQTANAPLRSLGDYVLTPGTPVKTSFFANDRFWLGVELVGTASSSATVSFTQMVGHVLIY